MLIIGLGNPGSQYELTKHSFGYWVVDNILEKCSLKWKSGYGDYIYAKHNNHIIAKPTTFMNNSGLAVKDLCRFHDQEKILVVYDDIDLDLGIIRFKSGGGTGGHKGIESIIYQLESEEFDRLKLGIAINHLNMKPSEHYVLKPFPKVYHEDVEFVINKATDAIDFYLENNIEDTMNKYNGMIEGEKNNDNK